MQNQSYKLRLVYNCILAYIYSDIVARRGIMVGVALLRLGEQNLYLGNMSLNVTLKLVCRY